MHLFTWFFLASTVFVSILLPTSGFAQTSLADLKAKVDANSQELDEVDALLSDVDPNRRAAAMNLLMESGNPAFIERAIEVGLLSSDARMRAVSLRKALESGDTFTLDVDLTDADEEETKIRYWLRNYGKGSWDETTKTGTVTFRVGEYDPKKKCWLFLTTPVCAMVVDGERVMLQGWAYGVGALTLADDGTLQGTFGYNYSDQGRPVPANIRLIE